MIATDTYPELDDEHVEALFRAARQAVSDAYEAVARLSATDSSLTSVDALALTRFLPRKYLPRYNAEFAQRFATSVVSAVWKLTEPNHVYSLACTAEELAMKYVLDLARSMAPPEPEGESQYDELADTIFEDEAFLVLWNQAQDGIEEAAQVARPGAVNLAFSEWFEAFGEAEQVHPFLQPDSGGLRSLWSETATGEEDLEDPTTEVFIALGEDWLEVPDQIAEQIPDIINETSEALFPERDPGRRLSSADRQQAYEAAAEDVRVLLEAARQDGDSPYEVWLISQGSGRTRTRYRLYSGLPLEEALTLRKVERMGDYRGVTDVELRVYPEGHRFDATVQEVTTPPRGHS